jgi:hypothetical protein
VPTWASQAGHGRVEPQQGTREMTGTRCRKGPVRLAHDVFRRALAETYHDAVPLVSILLPAVSDARFIDRTLQPAPDQTHADVIPVADRSAVLAVGCRDMIDIEDRYFVWRRRTGIPA